MKKFHLACIALALFVVPGYASAYLDPGTGSFVVQIAIASIAGLLFTAKTYWGRIKFFLHGFSKKMLGQKKDEHR